MKVSWGGIFDGVLVALGLLLLLAALGLAVGPSLLVALFSRAAQSGSGARAAPGPLSLR